MRRWGQECNKTNVQGCSRVKSVDYLMSVIASDGSANYCANPRMESGLDSGYGLSRL